MFKAATFYQYCNGKLIRIPFEALRKGMIFKKGRGPLVRCLSNPKIYVDPFRIQDNRNKQIQIRRIRHL